MKNGKNLALIGAAAVIAYLIYLYEKKKTAVASQITGFTATSTPTGVPITDQLLNITPLPLSGGGLGISSYANLLPTATATGIVPFDYSPAISELPLTSLPSYAGGMP